MAESIAFQRYVKAGMPHAASRETAQLLGEPRCEYQGWHRARVTRAGAWARGILAEIEDNVALESLGFALRSRETCRPKEPSRTIQLVGAERARRIKGVEAALLSGSGEERTLTLVAREHSDVDLDEVLELEADLTKEFGFVEVTVRVHQGRGPEVFAGPTRLF
jgi:hypothetical protein